MSDEKVMIEHTIPALTEAGDTRLVCPVCGDTHIDPVGLSCLPIAGGSGLLTVDSGGLRPDPRAPAEGRGVRTEMQSCGECGHAFRYRFHFHKGETSVERANGLEEFPATIWRD